MIESLWFRSSLYMVTALAVAVWLTMVIVTMPHLEALTGGQKVFDMRPTGYTFEEAKSILTGLGEAGRTYYRETQQGLDSVFPLLIFLTVSGWQIVLARKLARIGVRLPVWGMALLIGINLVGAIADYSENGAVRQMLVAGPDIVTLAEVQAANLMTVMKSVFNSVSYMLSLAMAGYYFLRRRRS
jgi:hypothetical protein